MADISGLVEQLTRDGSFSSLLNNPLAQFGLRERRYLGATLLPERRVEENFYVEEGIRYRSVIANDGTRYSPVQLKQGILVGAFEVRLGHSDIGSEFSSKDYDALLRVLRKAGQGAVSMDAARRLGNWADATLTRPLVEKNEKMIWEAIVDASVPRTGDNGYVETVSLSNPAGHRVAAGGAWSNNAYDPYTDIMAGVEKLASKGYTANRIFAGTSVISKLTNNEKIRTRVGRISTIGGTVAGLPGRASRAEINDLLAEDDIPPIEKYDLQYRYQVASGAGTGYFLKRDVFVIVSTQPRDETLDFGDTEDLTPTETLGYMAIGRAAGQEDPGRAQVVAAHSDKPPRVAGQAWQASFPVPTDPEAIYVITTIT